MKEWLKMSNTVLGTGRYAQIGRQSTISDGAKHELKSGSWQKLNGNALGSGSVKGEMHIDFKPL